MVGTPHQRRLGIVDSPELAWRDWQRVADYGDGETWPRHWGAFFCEHSIEHVFEFSKAGGLQFGAGQLAVNPVQYFHGVGQHNTEAQPAVEKQGGNECAEQGRKQGHLIRRNTCVAEPEHETIFEHGVE